MLKTGLRRFGLDVVKFPPPMGLHVHLRRFIHDHKIDTVLDVGAFTGLFCETLRRDVGYTGPIVSFEPCSGSFAALRSTMAGDPNWTGHRIGLSDTEGEAVINIFNSGSFNSLHRMRTEDEACYGVAAIETETIRLQQLDVIWHQVVPPSSKNILLKMDTQGHDTKVLQGVVKNLPNITGILSELPAIEIYDGMTSMADMISQLKNLGYTPLGFYPVNQPGTYNGAVPEFDALFLRRQK